MGDALKILSLQYDMKMISAKVCQDQPDLTLVCPWQAPGVLHHIVIRGIGRRKIFRNHKDREDFFMIGWVEVGPSYGNDVSIWWD